MKEIKLKIPEPCHENWDKMKPNEKGRFCNSCSKTVIDFTKKSNDEIKEYFLANRANGICGHFKKSQLDSIVIQIPKETFQYDLSFQKLFLLALLLTMGSMLFSCKTDSGKIQKIEKIEVIDTITKTVVDTLKIIKKDSLVNNKPKYSKPQIEKVEIVPIEVEPEPEEDDFPEFTEEPMIDGGLMIEEVEVREEIDEVIETDTVFKEINPILNPIQEIEGPDDWEAGDIEVSYSPEIPALYEEIKAEIISLLNNHLKKELKGKNITIDISIDRGGENEVIYVKTGEIELEEKIKLQLESKITPLIAVEVKKDSEYDMFYYHYKLTF